jgi:arabinofuranosyltransferase
MPAIGIFGYYVRLDQIVIDPMALSDPLLARTPVRGNWRIGHMLRELPLGYTESIATNTNQIADPSIHKLYDQIILITRGPLFTVERLLAIAELNLGVTWSR